jgi:hypothetical protein
MAEVALQSPISFFVDDSVFFAKGDENSVDTLKSALQTYCDGSGQKINLQKSSIFSGKHCSEQMKERVKHKLGVHDDTLQVSRLCWVVLQ